MIHKSTFTRHLPALLFCVLLGWVLGQFSILIFPAESKNIRPAQASPAGTDEVNSSVEKYVCLTFDDGPSKTTAAILEVLKQEQVPATFFVVTADYNTEYLPLISQAQQEGHQIALHSACHQYSRIYQSSDAYWSDISLLRQQLTEYVEDIDSLRFLRFPGGSTNTISRKYGGHGIMEQLKSEAEALGYEWVDWNVCAEDAAGHSLSPAEIYRNIVSSTNKQNRCIVLMHDSSATFTTAQALPDIIHWYKEQGYIFCTVEELYSK